MASFEWATMHDMFGFPSLCDEHRRIIEEFGHPFTVVGTETVVLNASGKVVLDGTFIQFKDNNVIICPGLIESSFERTKLDVFNPDFINEMKRYVQKCA